MYIQYYVMLQQLCSIAEKFWAPVPIGQCTQYQRIELAIADIG